MERRRWSSATAACLAWCRRRRRPSYDLAAALGTDALEEDLHLTKDCVLVARHNPWLSDNTNIAEVAKTNPAVAARKRTVPGVRVKVAVAATRTAACRLSDGSHRSRPIPNRC